MASKTVTGKCRMVRNNRRQPGIDAVAQIAFRRSSHMARRLAGCGHVIVATGAGAQHLGVIYPVRWYRRERYRSRQMTGVTLGGRGNVRRGLTTGGYVVMATDAAADHLGVIHIG